MDIDAIDNDLENLRDVFLQSEKDYIVELLKQPYYVHLFKRFYNESSEDLFRYSTNMIKSIELGKVHSQNLDEYEAIISILLLCTHNSMREDVKKALQKQTKIEIQHDSNAGIEL